MPDDDEVTRDTRAIELIMALRNAGIRDTKVLSALERVPRDRFIPDALAEQAYADRSLPIDCGQTISQPYVVAYMTEQLRLGPRLKVLEIGTGSGYQTAVLAQLCLRVYTIERYRTLLRDAEARFRAMNLSNITSLVGDGGQGWGAQAPFDRIIVTAAAATRPDMLLAQLKPGGTMIAPVANQVHLQYLTRYVRAEDGSVEEEQLLPVRFVPLVEGVARTL